MCIYIYTPKHVLYIYICKQHTHTHVQIVRTAVQVTTGFRSQVARA